MAKAVIFIGIQASGKSTFYHQNFSDCVHINLDTLHTRNKEKMLLEKCFANGHSFVVDNTNPTKEDRKRYIEAAKEHGYQVEGYFFQSVVSKCIKRNESRSGKACVPKKAIASTSNRLQLPSYEEGFEKLYFVHIEDEQFLIEPWKEDKKDEF